MATNQRDGQMTYFVDTGGENPHVNYEPSALGGLREAPRAGEPHTPFVQGNVGRLPISRTHPYKQAGERYRSIEQWERNDLLPNLVTALKDCRRDIQERMVDHFIQCDAEYGRRVAEGLGIPVPTREAQPVGD